MKNQNVYYLLIAFAIFTFIKKVMNIIIEIEFPTYDNLKDASEFWQILVKIRRVFAVITFFVASYLLFNYKLIFGITLILIITIINCFSYFLVDEKLIYLLIQNPSETTKHIITALDTYGDGIENLCIFALAFYALLKIFRG